MTVTMDPENFNSKELQELKSEFNDLKETLDKQRIVNNEILEHIQKQKISFIGKDLKSRMSTDIITIPMIFVICNTVRWPIMFAVAVSVWAILDLISVLWMKKKFNTSTLLESDVLTVAKSIKEYKKYYHLSVAVGAFPALAIGIYVAIRLYSQRPEGSEFPFVLALLLFTYIVGVLMAIKKYKKTMTDCDNLIDSLKE